MVVRVANAEMSEKINFPNLSTPYIIAEVGQNHQGSLETALKYVSTFASLGANAIKFQIRDNNYLLDPTVYNMPYESMNAFGESYGQHREFLELSRDDYFKLSRHCMDLGVDIIATPFDTPSLATCIEIGVNAIKIASFDLGNLSFISKAAATMKPLILSTGGGSYDHICASIREIEKFHSNFALLHCVSLYPCPVENVNLGNIGKLRREFPGIQVGLSDHFNGILTGPLAAAQGALVFEKHVTFDRSLKGTDHSFSLEPEGFRKFVRDINRTSTLLSTGHHEHLGNEPVFKKLGKSLILSRDCQAGHRITLDMLDGRICRPSVISVRDSYLVIGKKLARSLSAGSYLQWEDLSN